MREHTHIITTHFKGCTNNTWGKALIIAGGGSKGVTSPPRQLNQNGDERGRLQLEVGLEFFFAPFRLSLQDLGVGVHHNSTSFKKSVRAVDKAFLLVFGQRIGGAGDTGSEAALLHCLNHSGQELLSYLFLLSLENLGSLSICKLLRHYVFLEGNFQLNGSDAARR